MESKIKLEKGIRLMMCFWYLQKSKILPKETVLTTD